MELHINQLLTEKTNENSTNMDSLDSLGILKIINDEDRKIADAVNLQLYNIAKAVDIIVEAIGENDGRLIYIGAGTSGRLGVLDASECPPTFNTSKGLVVGLIAGGDYALRNAKEGIEDKPEEGINDLKAINFNKNDVLVGIAASGRTPYVIGALRYAKELGAKTIGISCNPNPAITEFTDISIEVLVGPEVVSGSTRLKAGTAQKMVLNMLTTTTMIKLGKTYKNYMIDVQANNEKLKIRAANMLMELAEISKARALELLNTTSWSVKEALIIAKTGADYERAKELLSKNKGKVSDAIDNYCHLEGEI